MDAACLRRISCALASAQRELVHVVSDDHSERDTDRDANRQLMSSSPNGRAHHASDDDPPPAIVNLVCAHSSLHAKVRPPQGP